MNNSIVPYNMNEAQNAYLRLQASLSRESLEAAISEIKTFLKMFPDVALAHNDLGVLYYRSGNTLLALANYEKANRIQPASPYIIKNLAEFYFVELGWTDDAIAMLTSLQKQYPQDCEILISLGMISENVGQSDEARTFYQRVLDFDPSNQAVREALARLAGPVSASEYRTIPALPSSGDTQYRKSPGQMISEAQQAIAQGDEYRAAVILEQIVAAYPGNAVAHNDLAVLYSNRGSYVEAKVHYERATAADPSNAVFRKNLADLCYSVLGQTDEAIEIYTALLKQYPADTEILTALAIISKANRMNEQARIFINKVLCLEPRNMKAREFLSSL